MKNIFLLVSAFLASGLFLGCASQRSQSVPTFQEEASRSQEISSGTFLAPNGDNIEVQIITLKSHNADQEREINTLEQRIQGEKIRSQSLVQENRALRARNYIRARRETTEVKSFDAAGNATVERGTVIENPSVLPVRSPASEQ